MKRLSIIVPVFNVEKYLAKCLDSLLDQDLPYQDYEIIIINDGSTDGSLGIAEKYVNQYSNLKLISQENKGLGGARNTGIKHAKGKYLMFVDSDDYIAKNCLAILLKRADVLDLDVLRYNHQEVNDDYKTIPKKKNATHGIVFKEDVINGGKYLYERLGWACYVWVYLFKTSFIRDKEFFFKSNLFFEDTEWLPEVLLNTKLLSSLNYTVYFYMQRKGSITKSISNDKKKKVVNDKIYVIDRLSQISERLEYRKFDLWFKGMITHTIISIIGFLASNIIDNKFRNEVFSQLKSRKLFPLSIHNFTAKQILFTSLININPILFYNFKRLMIKIKNI